MGNAFTLNSEEAGLGVALFSSEWSSSLLSLCKVRGETGEVVVVLVVVAVLSL